MKKVLMLCVVAQMAVGAAHAQYQNAVRVSSDTTRTSIVQQASETLNSKVVSALGSERDKHSWFIELAAGGGFYAAEYNRRVNNFLSRMQPSFQVGVGKWIAPSWALRLAAGYSKFKGTYYPYSDWNMFDEGGHSTAPAEAADDYYTDKNGDRLFKRKFDVLDVQFDLMYDVNRLFTTRKTPFDIIAYIGVGYSYAPKSQGISWNGSLNTKAGIDIHYNLSDYVYLKTAVEGTICDESLDGGINGYSDKVNRTIEGYAQALVGIGFNLGPVKKKTVKASIPYTVNVDRDYIVHQKTVTEDYRAPFVVRFYIDQYNIEADQELNIAKVCKYLEEHPNARLEMSGHADPETATPAYNQWLSERRCESVLNYINKNYNIDNSRIDVKPMGDKAGKFTEDFRWNRCVILTIIDK